MTDSEVQFNLRMPRTLRKAMERAAKDQRRSTTAEAIVRLQDSL